MPIRTPISYEAIRAEAEAERLRKKEEEARAAQQVPAATPVNRPEPPPKQFLAATPDGKLVDPTTLEPVRTRPTLELLDGDLPRRRQYPLGALPSQYTTDQAIRDAAVALKIQGPAGPQSLSPWTSPEPETPPTHWSTNRAPARPYRNPLGNPTNTTRTPEGERFNLPGRSIGEHIGAAYDGWVRGGVQGARDEVFRQAGNEWSEAAKNLAAGLSPTFKDAGKNLQAAYLGPTLTAQQEAESRRQSVSPTHPPPQQQQDTPPPPVEVTNTTPTTYAPQAPPPGTTTTPAPSGPGTPVSTMDFLAMIMGQANNAVKQDRFNQQMDIYAQLGVPTDGITIDNFDEGGGVTLIGPDEPMRIVGTPDGITAYKPGGETEFYPPSARGTQAPPSMVAQPPGPQQPAAPITIGAGNGLSMVMTNPPIIINSKGERVSSPPPIGFGNGLVNTPPPSQFEPLAQATPHTQPTTGQQYRIRTNPDGTTTVLAPHTPNVPLAPGETIADEDTLTRTGADWGPAVTNEDGTYRAVPDLLKLPPSVRKQLAEQNANLQAILAPQNLADTINSDPGYTLRNVPRRERLENDMDALRNQLEHPERYAPVGTSRHPGPNGEPSEMHQFIARTAEALKSREQELSGITDADTALETARIRERGDVDAARIRGTGPGGTGTTPTDNYAQTFTIAESITKSLSLDVDPTAIITPSGKGLYTINNDVLKMLVPTNNQSINLQRARLIQSINEDIRKRLDDPLIEIAEEERALIAEQYTENQARIEALLAGGGSYEEPANEDDAAVDEFFTSRGV